MALGLLVEAGALAARRRRRTPSAAWPRSRWPPPRPPSGRPGDRSREPLATTTASTRSSSKSARPRSRYTAWTAVAARRRTRARCSARHGAQPAVDAPVALQHQEVVHVVGVEVGQREGVVVARDRAEAGEDEVGPRQQHRQRVRAAPDVGLGDQVVVARARFEVAHHHHQVLGEQFLHAVGHRGDHADAVDAAVLHALRCPAPAASETQRDSRYRIEHFSAAPISTSAPPPLVTRILSPREA